MFGTITRTIDGHGDADSWSLSKSQRSQVMGSERWDIEQEMTINQHEDFDGSMVYTKSPKVELVEGLPALKYDEGLATDIDVSGWQSPSDHVKVKHNGAVIYDAVQGTPVPYSYATDAFAFEDNFDTVGNIAPRVGPSHGPGGEAAQIFAGATVFPGDNPGTTTSSWPEFPGTTPEPPPETEQPFRAWKTLYPTYDIEGNSLVRKGGALLAPGEEPVAGAWWESAPEVPDPPRDSSVVGYSINGKMFDTAIGAYGALIGQVAANTAYNLQEAGRATINVLPYAAMGPAGIAYYAMFGGELISAGPNWARDLNYPEDDFTHAATGFLGAAAVEIVTGTLLAKAGQVSRITRAGVPKGTELPILNPHFTPKPTALGKVGETLAGLTGNKTKILVNGRGRIPDGLDEAAKRLIEVKNVKHLSFTRQLRDYVDFANQEKYTFELFVPENTAKFGLSGPLRAAIERGDIILKIIPGL